MKLIKSALLCAILTLGGAEMANAQSIFDIFTGGSSSSSNSSSGSDLGSTLGNIIEGVFSSSDITVDDMLGVWTSDGPAVCFQGEGFLKQAGGIAAASAVETKLAPYYKKYGLDNAVLTINADHTFVLKTKKLSLKGNITPSADGTKGVFEFNFTALGSISIGSVTTYVQKTSGSMDVMFDASKLKTLISVVAKFSGMKLAKALSSILDSYDGLCIGFHTSKTGSVSGEQQSAGSGLGSIFGGIFGGNQNSQGPQNSQGTQNSGNKNSGNKNSQNSQNKQNSQNQQNTQSSGSESNSGYSLGSILEGLFGGGSKKN